MKPSSIIWTKTDEAPALASASLLPIVRSFLKHAGIDIEEYDISLAGRILANFADFLPDDREMPDYLARLEELVQQPGTNVIKLPNISASVPQLTAAIKELQNKGYPVPDYPEAPQTPEEEKLKQRFSKVLGSAVNPVLREGNADRRAAASVKAFALKNPHKMMKPWPETGSVTQVVHMTEKDFFGSEKSVVQGKACTARIEFHPEAGEAIVLKNRLDLNEDEVLDTSVMNVQALRDFYASQLDVAKGKKALLSLHLKATMMKVSDPIMFGHCVAVFFKDLLDKHPKTLEDLEVNLNNGIADLLEKIERLPEALKNGIIAEIKATFESQPDLAMVDSDKGITNLHRPNNVIIDASMPNIIRDGGKMWNKEGKLQDTIAVIPDRSYATMYQMVIEDCKAHGQFDPATMGNVSNVGLMAKKAEEYGSHDKTFVAPGDGVIKLMDDQNNCIMAQTVETGDIFRMCRTQDEAIRDWVKLGIARARATGAPAVFWLNPERAHDARIIEKVNAYLPLHDTGGLDIHIMTPDEAMQFTLGRVREGKDTISVTGNILRDYLTDLFPILELGTSSRMLSIVPLLKGGGLFETGAGGSAPKHVQQFLEEGHLRWDSLGEYCALVPSLELAAKMDGNAKAALFGRALDHAIGIYLENGKSPSRKVKEIDNRGATFYIALYWAKQLAAQDEDKVVKDIFSPVAKALHENEAAIAEDLLAAQGGKVDIGGYYYPDPAMTDKHMRPSPVFNQIVDRL
ncbi:NADP-dependent isocitrate dehydrogenase [Desulfosarcina ovata]|uniref:Isocitrate dehydrogenase [NADP] n=1 Tax=Desulfosarcina ovata subsp. ovata TaxID=2752305 RepID=A0A5K8AFC6_9BACT|nr:NADP-dependent isocitrate dehydrogenase [Desulfosarcina ovata]BBO91355.1 isocitrate dehydrogenase [Desulfosarcina ovata subsp. ovata]